MPAAKVDVVAVTLVPPPERCVGPAAALARTAPVKEGPAVLLANLAARIALAPHRTPAVGATTCAKPAAAPDRCVAQAACARARPTSARAPSPAPASIAARRRSHAA